LGIRHHYDDLDRDRDRGSSIEHHDKFPRTDRDDDLSDRRTSYLSDEEYDSYSEPEEDMAGRGGDNEYVSFRALLATCREFMGDDLPTVQPKPQPTMFISSFRSEPVKEKGTTSL
jgi:hypothetical protein